ncbi:MAG: SUMF1/EgtB/PvdO family nonheme iron enzyme [Anaerolineae bacterium]|nr:SUMF1/EgtB/PvdO family nonheme iron enzyme [Anaerolineae bacterium]
MPQIFISYSRVDLEFVKRLEERIRPAFPRLEIWRDNAPNGLIGGDNWWDAILRAIAESDVFVYVLSNESVQSPYCQAEFTEARRLQKRIVTIQARDRTVLTDALNDIQFIDMKNGPDDPEALPRLFAAITRQLELAKKARRPLWKQSTAKPRKEAPPTRPADAPEVETPPLARPSAEAEALRLARSGVRWQVIGVRWQVIGVVVAALALAVIQLTGGGSPTAVVQVSIAPATTEDATETPTLPPTNTLVPPTATFTATPTLTPTPTSTPDPQVALKAARAFSGTNADWQALYPNGFQYSFEDGVPMVLVPVGCFMMGSDDWYSDQQPVHEQCFDAPFWIDLTEVTWSDFKRLRGVRARPNYFGDDQHPVENITWFEARDFCAQRGARLPTEREWEYAARGPDALIYPWGNTWNDEGGWFKTNDITINMFRNEPADVGSMTAGRSWVGAYDMIGNVGEWMSSLYLPYDSLEDREADTGTRIDVYRVMRGGSWAGFNFGGLHASYRTRYTPHLRLDLWGFRCARSS